MCVLYKHLDAPYLVASGGEDGQLYAEPRHLILAVTVVYVPRLSYAFLDCLIRASTVLHVPRLFYMCHIRPTSHLTEPTHTKRRPTNI